MTDYLILTIVTMIFIAMTLAGLVVWYILETVPPCFGELWPAEGYNCDKCKVKEDCKK